MYHTHSGIQYYLRNNNCEAHKYISCNSVETLNLSSYHAVAHHLPNYCKHVTNVRFGFGNDKNVMLHCPTYMADRVARGWSNVIGQFHPTPHLVSNSGMYELPLTWLRKVIWHRKLNNSLSWYHHVWLNRCAILWLRSLYVIDYGAGWSWTSRSNCTPKSDFMFIGVAFLRMGAFQWCL